MLAILIGTGVRSLWTPGDTWHDGISFSAKYLLEVAVVLLGASVSAATILAAGLPLLVGIAGVVTGAILFSFAIGRLLGLPARMALLIACGNAICGNSAIAAVAPVIGADSDDVAASIAFTAVLGVAVVLGLPLLGIALGMNGLAFGAFARLTVYGVTQVIAAASPLVCLTLSRIAPRLAPQMVPDREFVAGEPTAKRPDLAHLVPWFIIGFLALGGCRSLGLVPTAAVAPIGRIATMLTVVSMAALGLGVDVRTVAKAGGRVTAVVIFSLLGLGGISLALLMVLHLV